MIKGILFFTRFFIFWLVFFFIDRAFFLLIQVKEVSKFPLTETLATFYHALLLDASMASYIIALPAISYICWFFSGRKTVELKWLSTYVKVLIIFFSIISVANFNIYREWGSKINSKALEVAFTTPNEALASSASSPIALTLTLLALLITLGFVLQRYIIIRKVAFGSVSIAIKLLIAVTILGLNFLVVRGGFSGSPINQSMAYFSKEQVLNIAAVNTEWNLLSSLISAKKTQNNPYVYLNNSDAKNLVDNLYHISKDTSQLILTSKRPNIVLFILESFTADLISSLGGIKGVSPGFDSLINEGYLFSKIYSTGNRTDKGFIATLSGFPTLAAVNIVKWPEKTEKLPALSRTLHQYGYTNSFYYGGESEFDNYKAFLLSHDIGQLVDKNDFTGGDLTSWGQYDGAVFDRQLSEIGKAKPPFFSTILTLTNHEPFTVPGRARFGNADNLAKFKSTAYYTDSCIQAYLSSAKKQAWYSNTLFIFIADHGHVYPLNRTDVFVPQRYHIPFLLYGDVIKKQYRGKRFEQVGSQADVAGTLLPQLGIGAGDFKWSKNLLNPYVSSFAFFSWDNGMGFIDNKQCVTFDNVGKMILYNDKRTDVMQTELTLKNAKAYLQTVYQQFLKF
ncbi:MAG: LTA synthase family protein [Bacteroidota bacterium]